MNDCLEFLTEAEAQVIADAIHAKMIAVDANYARSVQQGHTTAWAIPYQERDAAGKVVGTLWYVNVKDRARKAVAPADLPKLKPILKPVAVETVKPKA